MRLIINTSNLVVGGGVQVAVSILEELRRSRNHTFLVFLSTPVKNQIDASSFPDNFEFVSFPSPAALKSRRAVVKAMRTCECAFAPDAVLSVFGPAYWRPVAVHICGFALPWLINPESPAHALLGVREKFRNWLIKKYKWWHFTLEVDYIWCETIDVRERLGRYFGFPVERIAVISNSAGAHFMPYSVMSERKASSAMFKLLTVSAYYPHKNLEVIKRVIPYLSGKLSFCFILTIPVEIYENIFDLKERSYVKTLGPVPAADCPRLYLETDAVFLPSLMECFSANYPEAMVMKRPILTSDLGFAKTLLQDAAIYFDPLNAQDIAEKILELSRNAGLRDALIERGVARAATFSNPAERAAQLMDLCAQASEGGDFKSR